MKLPARSPDSNCYVERFVKSIKCECLDHLILSSVKHLDYVLEQYCAYYHHERIHQGVGRIIEPKHPIDERAEVVASWPDVCILVNEANTMMGTSNI